MRTLIGVDADQRYREAVDLLGRLEFRGNRIVLAHVQEPIAYPIYVAPDLYAADVSLERELIEAGEYLLEEAERSVRAAGLGSDLESVHRPGGKVDVLMDLAAEKAIDLVAVGSGRKGTLESLLKGSVGRALASNCEQSFLVAREGVDSRGPVRAVYATDLSILSERCLGSFLAMAPQGVQEITVVTSAERNGTEDLVRQFGYDRNYTGGPEELFRIATSVGNDMAERIRSLGYRSRFEWERGDPREALPAAMRRLGADLLILGARGHSFLERLFVGSVAYHEVSAEPYSVMVVREPREIGR